MMACVTLAIPRRLAAALFVAIVAVLTSVAWPASPAQAHAALVSSNPAKGAVVPTAPGQVALTFTEQVRPVSGKVRVIGPDGERADTGSPRVADKQLLIPMLGNAPRGTYLVTFRVASADNHPVSGTFTYSVGAPSPNGPPSFDGADEAPSTAVSVLFPVARWLGFAGLVLLIGSVFVLASLWPQRLDRSGPALASRIGAAAIAVSAIAELLLQVPYVAGGGLGAITSEGFRDVVASQYGAAHLIRLGVLASALVLFRSVIRGRGWGADRVLLGVLGVIGVGTWSVAGHPGATPSPTLTVAADMLHLGAAAVWLGGLIMLAVFLLPRVTPTELGAIGVVWSRWATYAVAVMLLTGVVHTVVQVGSFAALIKAPYGQLLLAKLGLTLALLAVAFVARRLVTQASLALATVESRAATLSSVPAMSAAAPAKPASADTTATPGGTGPLDTASIAGRLRRTVIVEAVCGIVVLALAAVLVQTTPARVVNPAEARVQTAVLNNYLFSLSVEVEPAMTGSNEIRLYVSTPEGRLADVKQWRVRAALPSQDLEPIDADVVPLTGDHANAIIDLPAPGLWRFAFTLRTSETDQATVAMDVLVKER